MRQLKGLQSCASVTTILPSSEMTLTSFDLAVDVYDSEGTEVQLRRVPSDVLKTKHLCSFKVPVNGLSFEELCGLVTHELSKSPGGSWQVFWIQEFVNSFQREFNVLRRDWHQPVAGRTQEHGHVTTHLQTCYEDYISLFPS
ncbi:hypothetical protein WJX74_009618 [Apatococcus lobatus]|uniref:Uncharacterized protein n=2 Tax=Apatococcus TaxID=904362 RepID=A0AAW1QP20_9CHLO